MEDGEEPPETCTEPPLNPALQAYVEAFHDLSGDRPVGMGVGYIPTAAILDYAGRIAGLTDAEELRFFLRAVRVIDHHWVKARSDDTEQRRKRKR